MKAINIHKRTIQKDKHTVGKILSSLSSWNNLVWPRENWPKVMLDNEFNLGSKGGHGIIRYIVTQNIPEKRIVFKFTKPDGFYGNHWIEINELGEDISEVVHTIDIKTNWKGALSWTFIVRPLHDALIEDAFDKLENNLDVQHKFTKWSLWVRFCRYMLTTKSK